MNQFKRAKQINNQTEKITDLKTAGVATPTEKDPTQEIEASIKKEKNNAAHSDTENTNTTQPTMSNTTQPTIPEKDMLPPKTNIPTVPMESDTNVIAQTPKTEPEPVYTSVATPEIIQQPVEYKEVSVLQTANTQPQIATSPQTIPPVVQPQYPETTIAYTAEPVETKPVKSSKKNAPNMFTQKSESKSIRKSLVLRPSSVKIAENYCAKNGGSFNELIQILLDNFIEEYGL